MGKASLGGEEVRLGNEVNGVDGDGAPAVDEVDAGASALGSAL